MVRTFEEEVILPKIPQSFDGMPACLPHMMLSHIRPLQPKSLPTLANEMRLSFDAAQLVVGCLLHQGKIRTTDRGYVKILASDGRGRGRTDRDEDNRGDGR